MTKQQPKKTKCDGSIFEISKKIKLLVLDVDGVLTTGDLWFTDKGEEIKSFHVHDGIGIKALLRSGIDVAIISGRKTDAVSKRMAELGIKYVYQGIVDKMPILAQLIEKLDINYDQVAYVGDDLPDLLPLMQVGLGVAVNNATPKVLQCAKLITKVCGGKGAVREVCDLLLESQELLKK